jgi:hypothetical protein
VNAILLLLVATTTVGADSNHDEQAKPRPLYEINREIRSLCQRDSMAKSDAERAAAAYEMTIVYREIVRDPRLPTSNTLKEYKGRLWSRLTRIKKDVQAKMRREGKSNNELDLSDEDVLLTMSATTQSLAEQFALVGSTMGGPADVFGQAAARGGGVGPPDYGPDLVDLIQRTIQPDFWDVNGGPGTIFYYRNLHCLVVRATSEVHHRLGGTLGALRD